jgi:hypothetical protein
MVLVSFKLQPQRSYVPYEILFRLSVICRVSQTTSDSLESVIEMRNSKVMGGLKRYRRLA